jgi:DNA-binding LacI/PurR family transcriptional regulator
MSQTAIVNTGGNMRSCTVKDVARFAGVSTATVSRVLNDAGRVSSTARAKVMRAISSLRYRPNAHASELGQANAGVPKKRSID